MASPGLQELDEEADDQPVGAPQLLPLRLIEKEYDALEERPEKVPQELQDPESFRH